MNETNTPQNPPEITYQVMPNRGPAAGPYAQAPMPPAASNGGKSSKWAYIIIAVIVLLILGGLAYYFLGYNKKEQSTNNTSTSRLPQSFLQSNFAVDICSDQSTCGEEADPDHDGLTNYQEFVAGTSAASADTDSDGIADGDEVNVYGTNPKNGITDTRAIAQQNNYTDGSSIKNGYDPLTPGDKYTETSLAQIQMKISQYQLHEPTLTTLGVNADGSKASADNGTSVNPAAGGDSGLGNSDGTPDTRR